MRRCKYCFFESWLTDHTCPRCGNALDTIEEINSCTYQYEISQEGELYSVVRKYSREMIETFSCLGEAEAWVNDMEEPF